MKISELAPEEYMSIFGKSMFVYGNDRFNELNSGKCDKVYYLCVRNRKFRMGIVGGKVGETFTSPFSAPFGGFVFSGDHLHVSQVDEAITLFVDWVNRNGMRQIRIVQPPAIYAETEVTKVVNSLLRNGFTLDNVDLNYSFSLALFDDAYDRMLHHNARKNLRKALGYNLQFTVCETEEDRLLCYEIIRRNRTSKGYPLRMSREEVLKTSEILDADYFLVRDAEGKAVASSIVFHVTDDIVQVIYWGSLPDYHHLRSVNYLSFKLFEHYKAAGKKIVDVGPSTENSVPNYGLCDFKESIGCQVSPKMSFRRLLALIFFSEFSRWVFNVENCLSEHVKMLPV